MKRCQFPHCGTVLREEGDKRKKRKRGGTIIRKFCSLHTRILIQNGVEYSHNRFYVEKEGMIKGKNKAIHRIVPNQIVRRLKEIAPIDDFLASEFESDREAIRAGLL